MAEIEGFDELSRKLRALSHRLDESSNLIELAIDSALEDAARAVERTTKENLKKHGAIDTGTLRKSYRYAKIGSGHYVVGTSVEYAPHIEFGRGPITADEGYLRFEGEDGEIVYRKSVGPAPAQPHVRPALVTHRSTLVRNIQQEINRVFEAVFN